MEEHPFFRFLKRFNLVALSLLLAGMLAAALIGLIMSIPLGGRGASTSSESKTSSPAEADPLAEFHLSGLTRVNAETQYLSLISDGVSKRALSSSSYSSGETHNILFVTGSKLQTHWLLAQDTFLIDSVDLLKSNKKNSENPVLAIYYQIHKEDSNQDGRINYQDTLSIALSSPNGEHFQEIDHGFSRISDHQLSADGSEITVLAEIKKHHWLKKYDLKSGRLVAEQEIQRAGN